MEIKVNKATQDLIDMNIFKTDISSGKWVSISEVDKLVEYYERRVNTLIEAINYMSGQKQQKDLFAVDPAYMG